MPDGCELPALDHVLKIGLLGAVRAWREHQEIPLGPPRQRAVLAMLALEAGRAVSVERLIEGLWGERAPAGARGMVQGYVSRLRPALARAGVTIAYYPRGYLLVLPAEQVDVHEFRIAVARARTTESDEAQAAGLRRALALWRGEPLTGVSGGGLLDRLRDALGEERLAITEECLNVETRAGRHAGLVPELTALVAEHPFREGLVGLLMLALCRAGRRVDALEQYERTRRRLIEELGLDPGPELLQLRQRILRGNVFTVRSPGLSASAEAEVLAEVSAVPAQLPPKPGQFTGRAAELGLLDSVATGGDTAGIAMITGAGGVGKTALALHWGHRIRSRFPDGQLYVNLHGHSPERPLRPIEALGQFLRGLGVPAERVPAAEEEASAAYRSLLADRRILVILDDAGSEEQVRPLLPSGRRCAAVITSRDRLAGLVARDGAVPVPLGMLAPDEAGTLFGRLLGGERLAAERDAARELARVCGYLPLALRIAAAGILGRPSAGIAGQVRRLTMTRLSSLAVGGDPHAAVRGAFDLSYRRLDPPSRRLFRLLGLIPGPTFTAEAAAALSGAPLSETDHLLCRLAAAHLIEEGEPGRYTFHDLMREYARERARAEESEPDRTRALDALMDWYLRVVREAGNLAHPHPLRAPTAGGDHPIGFTDRAAALAWMNAERANLVAAVKSATQRPHGWQLMDAMNGYPELTGGPPGWTGVLLDTQHRRPMIRAAELENKRGI
ncbi:AfsR/SARP family transcriptional regulator [Nonomuraea sp. NEAU-A123]|uniref:AfsR/SARP family transcriptional regulator n=1 Tax=Nonomuraea sp. NEAU-A123 TaxID=2839649 RepID=UPI001BE4387E|nr:AfsR/SARP family transcriptional regulator [Nonomuraea sp. NEAU-A123]MBT2224892.1 transcriptional regulator [Nonomuraea sp. NEAU-A123]